MQMQMVLLEILAIAGGLFVLVLGLVLPKDLKKITGGLSVFFLAFIFGVSFFMPSGRALSFYHGLFVGDEFALFFKQLFVLSALLVSLLSLVAVEKFENNRSEFFAVSFFALAGMMAMVSANDWITLFIGLELMTISFVILTAYNRLDSKSAEAGLKYILLSAMSTGLLLYGMSVFYGLTGSVRFEAVFTYLQGGLKDPIALLAIIFLIAGFGFKISMVPFHMWSPDVYEGAPTPITAFLSVGSKAAGFAVLLRLFLEVFPAHYPSVTLLLIVLAVLTMLIGNVIAIPQENIKRMLAYSSIAQAGYILLGLIAYSKEGISALFYYLILFVFANIGIFAAIIAVSHTSGDERIQSLSGVWKRSPLIAGALLVNLLSLAGIPPAAGFVGKFYLFTSAIQAGYLWLALVAISLSVVAVYYYIVVIRVVLVGEAKESQPLKVPFSLQSVLLICTIATLFLGIFPGLLTEWTSKLATLFMAR